MARKTAIFLILCIFTCSVFGEEPINIPDPNLKEAIENWLEVSEPNISDMSNLIHFSAYHKGIKNLTGLEYATNLEKLWLGDNQIEDISIISGLTNLKLLHFYGNKITDISALSGLVNLEVLYLYGNMISDISILSELTNLEDLRIQGNQISDISPLSGITSLKQLDLHINQISNISALSGLINLEDLQLNKNQISDISSLSGLVNLERLSLFENQISDISSLSSLVKLHTLNLYNNKISDISHLASLTNILGLGLGKNQIEDLSPLSNLKSLVNLQISENIISDLSHLSELSNLETLWLADNQIYDISPLSGFINLKELYLYGNMINDISAISGLNNLQKLYINKNSIEDISVLTDLPNLVELNLLLNPLNADAYCKYIPLLAQKDIEVSFRISSPVNVSATDGTYINKVQITWDPIDTGLCEASYRVCCSKTPYGRWKFRSNWQTSTTYEDTTALPGEKYYYWIDARIEYKENTYNESLFGMFDSGYIFDANSGNYRTIYVDDKAAGNNDGSSWKNAYNFLQDALLDANNPPSPVEIHIAQGEYKPDHGTGFSPGDQEASFKLESGITLMGGYAGANEPDPNARNIEQYKTILSGDLNNDDVSITNAKNLLEHPTMLDNSYHVLTINDNDSNSILDGIIITGGYWPHYYDSGERDYIPGGGAGIYCNNSSIQLLDCIFENNCSLYIGGAVFIEDGGKLSIDNCEFIRNASPYGGALVNNSNEALIRDCIFRNNYASEKGGAMRNVCDNLLMTNCIFENNISDKEGGAYHNSFSDATIQNCTFKGNYADCYGGGIFNTGQNNLKILNCIFKENSTADYGAGIFNVYDANPLIQNCIFVNNSAGFWGGAIQFWSCYGTVRNCTITNNHAVNGGGIGSGFWDQDQPSGFEITNCILWNNGTEIYNDDDSFITLTYSCVEGLVAGRGGSIAGNCLNTDPCFANPDLDDYHLKSQAGRWDPNNNFWVQDDVTSFCIDAGKPNSNWSQELWPHGKRINIGAYGGTLEASMSLSEIGDCRDLNNDDSITWNDILLLTNKWNCSDVPLKEDLNLDGIVDTNDLFFYADWLTDTNNIPAVMNSIENKITMVGNELSFSVSATDTDNDELIYKALGLPKGAEFSEQTFTWTPEEVGTYFVTFIVSDYKSLDYVTVQIVVE